MTNEEICSLCAETLSIFDYNRLASSWWDPFGEGELQSGQKQLLAKINPLLESPIEDVETLRRVFVGTELQEMGHLEWTKERFLCEIELNPIGGFPLRTTPYHWFAEAWQIDHVRWTILDYQIRDINKTGSLFVSAEYLDYFNHALTVEQLVEYYITLAGSCQEREREFRPEFEMAFPKCVHALPPLQPFVPTEHDPTQEDNPF